MRMLLAVAAMAAALGMNDTVLAEGSVEAGQQKAAVCLACHGPDGNSMNPEWPSLAGQHAEFIVAQLQAFQSGERQNPLMSPMAIGLTEQDMLDLGAYYEAQQPAALEADPELVEAGRRLYLGGDLDRGHPRPIRRYGDTVLHRSGRQLRQGAGAAAGGPGGFLSLSRKNGPVGPGRFLYLQQGRSVSRGGRAIRG